MLEGRYHAIGRHAEFAHVLNASACWKVLDANVSERGCRIGAVKVKDFALAYVLATACLSPSADAGPANASGAPIAVAPASSEAE